VCFKCLIHLHVLTSKFFTFSAAASVFAFLALASSLASFSSSAFLSAFLLSFLALAISQTSNSPFYFLTFYSKGLPSKPSHL